ncbi:hypothetical protein CYLTODRAFT_204826 [Cylindrobasidium torrendii FP15055 ss-10]|uniref:Uncharacterized protein n=1 Tax=Cylindrobasidium torrendii FP15055 ss-10 TaxID=1314674 RepID=A0A0D7AWY6_9AGAR|nr:hypothetical protein CYLTODRAFT_204826 [Cylindrobasidium torrendii FP15055 ss-10]
MARKNPPRKSRKAQPKQSPVVSRRSKTAKRKSNALPPAISSREIYPTSLTPTATMSTPTTRTTSLIPALNTETWLPSRVRPTHANGAAPHLLEAALGPKLPSLVELSLRTPTRRYPVWYRTSSQQQ